MNPNNPSRRKAQATRDTDKQTSTNQQQRRGRHRIKYTEEREDNKTQVRVVNNR